MRTLGLVAVFVAGVAAVTWGQDAVKHAPESYKLQFENEWVKIVRVHYEPLAKLPAHTHTELATAYVSLNDSGPVIFKHVGTDYGPPRARPPRRGASGSIAASKSFTRSRTRRRCRAISCGSSSRPIRRSRDR